MLWPAGLYIPDEPRFGAMRGMGVRIEDDVLITQVRGPNSGDDASRHVK